MWTPAGPARVLCKVVSNGVGLRLWALPCGPVLTPCHPVRVGGAWSLPRELGTEQAPCATGRLYNFVLDSGHVLDVDSVECVTLGNGFDLPVGIARFGTEAHVQELRAKPGWREGLVDLTGITVPPQLQEGRSEGQRRQEACLATECDSPLDEALLLRLHRHAMSSTGVGLGYRTGPMQIAQHTAPAADEVATLMQGGLAHLSCCIASGWDAYDAAALGHWLVSFVHPFNDGNGRAGRGLAALILLQHGINLVHSHAPFHEHAMRCRYFEALRRVNESARVCTCCGATECVQGVEHVTAAHMRPLSQLLRELVDAELVTGK